MSKLDLIYGDYLTHEFVDRLFSLACEARQMAKLHRNDSTYKDLHCPETKHSADAVAWWQLRIEECEEWIREKK